MSRRHAPSSPLVLHEYEAQLYSIGPLLKQAEDNPALAAVLYEFDDIEEYQQTVEELKGAEDAT